VVPAHKSRWFERWFAGTVRGRLSRQFEAVRVQGLDAFHAAAAERPLLAVCNHSAWWDSLLAIALVTGELKLDGYALMEARNLRRFPFLGRVGGFGVERGVPDDGARAITYGAGLLDRPGRVVWVFPEGREMPFHRRPLVFKRGAAAMLEQAASPAARWVPVSVAYVFGAEERPTIWMTFGAPQTRMAGANADLEAERQAAAVQAGLDRIAAAVEARVDTGAAPADFPAVITGTQSRFGALATALLARMTRFKALDGR
jgi:hypothetical protein